MIEQLHMLAHWPPMLSKTLVMAIQARQCRWLQLHTFSFNTT
jgi:hypothetical protein